MPRLLKERCSKSVEQAFCLRWNELARSFWSWRRESNPDLKLGKLSRMQSKGLEPRLLVFPSKALKRKIKGKWKMKFCRAAARGRWFESNLATNLFLCTFCHFADCEPPRLTFCSACNLSRSWNFFAKKITMVKLEGRSSANSNSPLISLRGGNQGGSILGSDRSRHDQHSIYRV
jgi:hypothetical protein